MKQKILSLCLTFAVAFSALASFSVYADETADYVDVNVTAEEIEQSGAYNAIQRSLNIARSGAADDKPYKITVEGGVYTLEHGLRIYSNTYLSLDNVTLTRDKSSEINLIRIGDNDSKSDGVTGYDAYRHITINGGVFDGAGTANTMVKFAHASDISLTNATLKNTYNGHILEAAGVDGMTVKNCVFQNQKLAADKSGYEAIQLDVLINSNFTGARSEDLPMKNVTVTDCTFSDCPRGIGNHTAINNAPFENIKITNCSFKDMGSCAIQGMNWKNCTISNNTIDGSPRGIAVYSVMNNGSGTFNASDFAKEGNTTAHVSDKYQTPFNSNILIADNTLQNCGDRKDIYASYECGGIFAVGYDLSSSTTNIAKGNYYLSGVTIKGNVINAKGHGVRLMGTKATDVVSNIIKCAQNTVNPANYYGISVFSGAAGKIADNTVDNAPVNGIYIYNNASAQSVESNIITNAPKYGIGLNAATVKSIAANDIHIKDGAKKYIDIASTASANVADNYYSNLANISSLAASSVSQNSAALSWKGISGAKGYNIYQYNSDSKIWRRIGSTSNTSYSLSKLVKSTKYSYAVKAYTTKDGQIYYSKSYISVNFTTKGDATGTLWGDANGDGNITAADVLIIRKYIAGQSISLQEKLCDVNQDSKITSADVLTIRKHIAGQQLAPWN